MLTLTHFRCELKANPIGIDAESPRLSWMLESTERGQKQTAYRVLVATSESNCAAGKAELWDSGKIDSAETTAIRYAGEKLSSEQQCFWKVIVWDKDGTETTSEPQRWQMGLLASTDWRGQWISAPFDRDVTVDGLKLPPSAEFRKKFVLQKPLARATLHATALGVYELDLNGSRVGDAVLAPGWTDYRKRIAYQSYDVTSQLTVGENRLGALLGDGWYCGYIGFHGARDSYGQTPQLLAQLNLEYQDGTREEVVTDGTWVTSLGPIRYSDMLMGEWFDARKAAADWQPVGLGEGPEQSVNLIAQPDPVVRVLQDLAVCTITTPSPGVHIFDMGQNMVGWAKLQVEAPAGTQIQLRFAEMLNPDGTLYTTNLRSARQTDTYICRGGGVEVWEPHFAFHGFRYAEITGYPGTPTPEMIVGRVIHSDTPLVGRFECSSPLVNQLQKNIVWGQRGNFLSIPTDCPQRDERLGWMGDAQIFVRTATCNADVQSFFEKWMDDVTDAQSADGGFPDVAPRLVDFSDGAPAWGDAGVIVPWTIYLAYGDKEILRHNYRAMAKWIDYLSSVNPDGLWENRRNNDFGDWLSIEADTPKDVLATAYFAYDARLMAKIARVLGETADAAQYDALFQKIKSAFNAAYVQEHGKIKGDTQTVYLLALRFGLLPENLRARSAERLVTDIKNRGTHLSTGFVGVGYLCPMLTSTGHNDVAYQLLLNETFPSWGYSIRQGATTIWERWDGWTEEKGFQDPGMNSFNHYSLGSVGEWLYRSVAGIDTDPEQPGFAHILIHPHPGPGLTWATAEYDSVRGRIRSSWRITDGALSLDITIPANTHATVTIPALPDKRVTESSRPLDGSEGVVPLNRTGTELICRVGSGSYRFEVS